MAQLAVLQGAGKVGEKLFPTLSKSFAGQVGVQAATGPYAQAAVDLTAYGLGLQTGYGSIQALVEGKGDEFLTHVLGDAFTFAGFAALHGMPELGRESLKETAASLEAKAKAGQSVQSAARAVEKEQRRTQLRIGDSEPLSASVRDMNPAERKAMVDFGEGKVFRVKLNDPDGKHVATATVAEDGDILRVPWFGAVGKAGGEGRGENQPFGAREILSVAREAAEKLPEFKTLIADRSVGRIRPGEKWVIDLEAMRGRGKPKTAGPAKNPATLAGSDESIRWKQQISPDEPPVAEGMIRMYHGGVLGGEGGRWLTPDRTYAEGYASKSQGGEVGYVDLPRNSHLLSKSYDDTGTSSPSPPVAFEAPEEIARQIKTLKTGSSGPAPAPISEPKPTETAPSEDIANQRAFLKALQMPGLGRMTDIQVTEEAAKRGWGRHVERPAEPQVIRPEKPPEPPPAKRELPEVGKNYLRSLSDFGDRIYRETSVQRLEEFLPFGSEIGYGGGPMGAGELFFATSEHLALGQKENQGVMMRFDAPPKSVEAKVNTSLPGWEFLYSSGEAELIARHSSPRAFKDALRSFTVRPNAKVTKVDRERYRRFMAGEAEKAGWSKYESPDGSVTYARPGLDAKSEAGTTEKPPEGPSVAEEAQPGPEAAPEPPKPAPPPVPAPVELPRPQVPEPETSGWPPPELARAFDRRRVSKRDQEIFRRVVEGGKENTLEKIAADLGMKNKQAAHQALLRLDEKLPLALRSKVLMTQERLARAEAREGEVDAGHEEEKRYPPPAPLTREERQGKKLEDLADDFLARAEAGKLTDTQREAFEQRADLITGREEAKKIGFTERDVDDMAQAILEEQKPYLEAREGLYRDAYKAGKRFGLTPQKFMAIAQRGKRSLAGIEGMDDVAQSMKALYPQFFPEERNPSDVLAELLQEGKPKGMTRAEAQDKALERLVQTEKDNAREAARRSGESESRIEEVLRGGEEVGAFEESAGQAEEEASEVGEFAFGANAPEFAEGPPRDISGQPFAMGAAAFGELTPAGTAALPRGPTALKNAQIEQERAAEGLSPIIRAARAEDPAVWDAAMRRIDIDPDIGRRLVEEISEKPRPVTDVEAAIFLREKIRLNNEYRTLSNQYDRMTAEGADPTVIVAVEQRLDGLMRDRNEWAYANDRTGNQWGKAGRWRQLFAAEDYSLLGMLREAKTLKGEDLTPQETNRVKEIAGRMEKALEKGETPAGRASQRSVVSDFGQLKTEIKRAKETAVARVFRRTGSILDLLRSIRLGFDLPPIFRQGGMTTLGRPKLSVKSLVDSFSAAKSEFEAHMVAGRLTDRENYKNGLYERALGLNLDTVHGLDEFVHSDLGRKVPVLSHLERAHSAYLMQLRADLFDSVGAGISKSGRMTEAEAKIIGNAVNVFTGRGNLGQAEKALGLLNKVFLAPKWVASRFQAVLPIPGNPLLYGLRTEGIGLQPRARLAVAKEYARFGVGLAAIYALANMAGVKVEWDPKSADFGEIRVGETRMNPAAGLNNALRFVWRLATGKIKSTSTGETRPMSRAEIIGSEFRNKLAPVPGAAWSAAELATGTKPPPGRPTTAAGIAADIVVPLTAEDFYKASGDLGLPKGIAVWLWGTFGGGVRVHEKPKSANR